ncbi:MAG: carbon monoxide dehydrogenase [Chloroflexi bacterium]|nr:carbon monoxide dehydrogenase [Chloroflexota bacterium]
MEAIFRTDSSLAFSNHLDHFMARWGYRRGNHRVEPGLYRLGNPDPKSPVFVTANYTLSFDALRNSLKGQDGYILVLDTHGINVWCAAGKGTFSTDELVKKIEECNVKDIVTHRVLILPQLGASGVSAHEVKQRTHFKVEYGPVRAADLPEYLQTHQATPAMRKVSFTLAERLVLVPVELVQRFLPFLAAFIVLWLLLSPLAAWGALAAMISGCVLFPVLLPWLPTRQFSIKGFVLGGLVALPFVLAAFLTTGGQQLWQQMVLALAFLTGIPAVTAYLGLNFTGSTPLTSHTEVEREMKRYIRVMAGMAGICIVCIIASIIVRFVA